MKWLNQSRNIRKEKNFELTDRIVVHIEENEALQDSIIQFKEYICREILADSLEFTTLVEGSGIFVEVNDIPLQVSVNKKTN